MSESAPHPVSTLSVSKRVTVTEDPPIVFTRKTMALNQSCVSMAQGIVYWSPPQPALDVASSFAYEPPASVYGPSEGTPALRAALVKKVSEINGLQQYNICITHGANQAFTNTVLALSDASESVVLFGPAYFDHIMSVQITGGAATMLLGPRDQISYKPSAKWLKESLEQRNGSGAGSSPRVSMVVICNPCNPTGVLMDKDDLEEMSALCATHGVWLIVDSTYEDFVFDGHTHHCPAGPHVINLFSFSKAYGMMGWRVGYIAYPDYDGLDKLGKQFIKCQDTLCICATQISQQVALKALDSGRPFVESKLAALEDNRRELHSALAPLGQLGDGSGNVVGGQGIYIWAKLPLGCEDDMEVVKWLVMNAGVCVVPGSSCHGPGYVRCSFGNLPPPEYKVAAARLKAGLVHLVAHGMTPMPAAS